MTRLRTLILTTAVLGAALIAGTTLTALRGRQPDRARQGRGGPPSLATLLDANHDQVISADEIAAAPAALRALDTNKDGQLQGMELFAGGRGGRGGRGPGGPGGLDGRGPGGPGGRGGPEGRMGGASGTSAEELTETLMAFDKNADGKLVREEVPERFQGVFDRADTNKDGSLTREEINASASTAAAAPGAAEDGRGRGGRGGPMDPIVAAIDTNHDGTLSEDEIAAAPQALRSLDKNGDGSLSADEARTAFGRGRGEGRDGDSGRDRGRDRMRTRVGALA